jgi:SAM-dependent methyltransferase
VVPQAQGRILEIGLGAGHNLPHYDHRQVDGVVGIDPCEESWRLAKPRVRAVPFDVEFKAGSAEDIPAKLVFCEHGEAPDANVAKWQNRVNPIWKVLFGGCNLNRNIVDIIDSNGFRLDDVDQMYLPGTPRVAGFNIWGTARPD